MKPVGHKESSLKTTKKGNVTINPKKEDLMSENLRSRIQSSVEALKEAAKKKDKHIKAAKAGSVGKTLTETASGMSLVRTLLSRKRKHVLLLLLKIT